MTRVVTPAEFADAGRALFELRQLWPIETVTVYVGLNDDTTQVHVGWILDRSRKASRISAPTLAQALERARDWTSGNPARIEAIAFEDRRFGLPRRAE